MKKIIAASLCLLSLSSASFAGEPMNQHVGPYVEITGGTNAFYLGVVSSEGSSSAAGIQGYGWSVAAGYKINKTFGLEAGFLQSIVDINDYKNGHINVPYATTRFTVPMGERFSFIGKIGAGYANVPGEGGVLVPYTGVGFGYAVTNKLDVSVQYQGAVYGIFGAGLLSGGIGYSFG